MSAVADPPATSALYEALLDLRSVAPKLPRDKTADTGKYTYSYTSLDKIAELIDPLLMERGLLWLTKPAMTSTGEPALAYKLVHVLSGETEEGVMPLPGIENSQDFGSGISYGRRYAKVAVLDLIAEDDDDGKRASAPRAYGSARTGGTTVNLRNAAKGISDRGLNKAREQVGLPTVEEQGNDVWLSFGAIQPELATQLEDALATVKADEG